MDISESSKDIWRRSEHECAEGIVSERLDDGGEVVGDRALGLAEDATQDEVVEL